HARNDRGRAPSERGRCLFLWTAGSRREDRAHLQKARHDVPRGEVLMRGQGILMLALLGGCQTTQDMQDPSPQACANCHMPEYKAAKGHVGARPTTCGICHAKNDWEPSRLEHPVPLLGAHA